MAAALVLGMLGSVAPTARADDGLAVGDLLPGAVALQVGRSERSGSGQVAVQWAWGLSRPLGAGTLSGAWELGVGAWRNHADDGEGGRTTSLLSLTPVLRWGAAPGTPGVFLEGGIGLNAVAPVYRHRNHRFSTVFNFGDHLAAGIAFGDRGRHELALRVQHFSNAGLREPNPGEDFVQLRYLLRL